MHYLRRRAVLILLAAAGLATGAVTALALLPGDPSRIASLPAAARAEWPDASLDVCVVNLSTAPVDTDAVEAALVKLDSLEASRLLNLPAIPKTIVPNCGATPPFDPSVGLQNVQSSAPTIVESKGPLDAYLYVYDSPVIEQLGNTWLDRMAPQETLHEGDTYVPLASALFVSASEFHDSEAMYRLLGRTLGLAGKMNPLRMTIDNACSKPGSEECGPDVFAQD